MDWWIHLRDLSFLQGRRFGRILSFAWPPSERHFSQTSPSPKENRERKETWGTCHIKLIDFLFRPLEIVWRPFPYPSLWSQYFAHVLPSNSNRPPHLTVPYVVYVTVQRKDASCEASAKNAGEPWRLKRNRSSGADETGTTEEQRNNL